MKKLAVLCFAFLLCIGAEVLAATPVVVNTISLSSGSHEILMLPNGKALVANYQNPTVAVVNVATRSVASSFSTPYPVWTMVATSNGTVYALGGTATDAYVMKIDTSTFAVVDTVLSGSGCVDGAVLSPDQSRLLIMCKSARTITVLNVPVLDYNSFWSFEGDSETGFGRAFPRSGVFAGGVLWIAADNAGLAKIDPNTGTYLADVTTGPGASHAYRLALSPNGAVIYSTDLNKSALFFTDVATGQTLAQITVGGQPRGLVVSSDGSTIYTANSALNTVSKVDVATATVTDTVMLGSGFLQPFDVKFQLGNERYLWVTNASAGSLMVLDTAPAVLVPALSPGASSTVDTSVPGTNTYAVSQGSGSTNVYGVSVPSATTSLSIQVSGANNKPSISIVANMPAGANKTVSMPTVSSSKVCVSDHANAVIDSNGGCNADRITYPNTGCVSQQIAGDSGDGTGPTNLHTVTACVSGGVVTISGLKHTALWTIADTDNDGITDEADHCPGTVLAAPGANTRPGHLDDSATLLGCNRTQVLACKPGSDNGEKKFGLTPGSQDIFSSKVSNPRGWAVQCLAMYPNP
jgi:YVTN family beta-propeller protein